MTRHSVKFTACLAASAFLLSLSAQARMPTCGKNGPSKSIVKNGNSEYDNFRSAKDAAVNRAGNQVFNNKENVLDKLGSDEAYYEYDLGQDGFGGRGAHRAVVRVTLSKRAIQESYYTQDHYKTFCLVN